MISGISTSIGTSSAAAWLKKDLASSGLSADKADVAASDLFDAATTSLAANPDESDGDFRAALFDQIDQDVTTGKLSQDDADNIKKWLDQTAGPSDQISGTSDQASADDGAASGNTTSSDTVKSGAAGAGSGGSAVSKTEVSRIVTVSGSVKTTVIAYSDGSSETEIGTATTSDDQKYRKDQAGNDGAQATDDVAKLAKDYLSQTRPGMLVSKNA